jgi:hypothetical protein
MNPIEYPSLQMVFHKEAHYLDIEPQTKFRSSSSYLMGESISNIYSGILKKSSQNPIKIEDLYILDDSKIEFFNTSKFSNLVKDKLVQQLFYLYCNPNNDNLEYKSVLVAGNITIRIWEALLRKSLLSVAQYCVKKQQLDIVKLKKIFCIYHFMDQAKDDPRIFPELPILDKIAGLDFVPIDIIKQDLYLSIKSSLDTNNHYLYAEGIGFFYLPDTFTEDLLPYLERKIDSQIFPEIKKNHSNWELDFRNRLNIFFTSKPNVAPNKISVVDSFILKATFIDEKKEQLTTPKIEWLGHFLVSIAFKLKLYRTKNLDFNSTRSVNVIKQMINVDNDLYSRVLKIEIGDELLGENVLDHLYTDPNILHSNWYDDKGLHILFVRKDAKNLLNLFEIMSLSLSGYEHAVLLEKILDDNSRIKKILMLDEKFRRVRIRALFATFSDEMSWWNKILFLLKFDQFLVNAVEEMKSKIVLDQLNLRFQFHEKTKKHTIGKVDAYLKSYLNPSPSLKRDFIQDAKEEGRILFGEHPTNEQILSLLPNFTQAEVNEFIK